jgi:Spy/CpxP family protein refolding chaperone
MRLPHAAFVLLLACSSKSPDSPAAGTDTKQTLPAAPSSDPWGDKGGDKGGKADKDLDDLAEPMNQLKEVRDYAAKEARREEDRDKQQTERLAQTWSDVQRLIAEGNLDQAELRAAEIRWQPDSSRSQISETDAKLIQQYDEQRETALRVIKNKR